MANVDWSDDEAVLNFFESDSEDENFEGFDTDDVTNTRVIGKRRIDDFSPEIDRDLPVDLDSGWTRIDSLPLNAPFTGESKLNVNMENFEPLDFLKLFIDDDLINTMVFQTNLYAEVRKEDETLKQFSRQKKWRPIDRDEMKVFLSLIIAMGVVQKSDIQHYWSNEYVHETKFFGKYMARDRFLIILSNFHLEDNARQVPRGQPGFDPLFKVRPLVSKLISSFTEVYSPERDLSFDEATCAWKGRLRFKVYNPAKPTRFGIKLYQVCEASSGYCLGFDVYTGNTPCMQYAEALGIDEDCSNTTKIVTGLLARCGLLDKGHHVYMDNYYTSPELFTELDLQNMYACGTLRKNRKNVPEVFKRNQPKMKPSETIFRRNRNLLAVKYHDKRDVHMLSTIHEATVDILNKVDRNTNAPVTKPTCIFDYMQLMGGVDLSDQINQNYSCLRKTTKWYKKLAFHLFNLAVINAYLLYKKFFPGVKKMDHHAFKIAICKALLADAPEAPRPSTEMGRKSLGDKQARLTERHFPEIIPPKPGAKRARPCRDCAACNPKKSCRVAFKRKQTTFWCSECQKALCVPTCFRAYHTVQNYRAVSLPDTPETGENDSSSDTD